MGSITVSVYQAWVASFPVLERERTERGLLLNTRDSGGCVHLGTRVKGSSATHTLDARWRDAIRIIFDN